MNALQFAWERTPKTLMMFLFFLCGWAGAHLLRKLTLRVLRWLNTEEFAEKAGIEQFLLRGGVQFTTTTILAQFVFWGFLFFAILTGLNYGGMPIASELLARVFLFIPQIVTALVILLFGFVFARFLKASLAAYLNNLGVSGVTVISNVAYFTLVALVIVIVMEYLEVGSQVLTWAFLMAFGALCLAVGISFGLAGRKLARDILERVFKR